MTATADDGDHATDPSSQQTCPSPESGRGERTGRIVIVGAAGSGILAAASWVSGWLPPGTNTPLPAFLHTAVPGRILLTTLILVGGLLLVGAWLALGTRLPKLPDPKRSLRAALLAWALPLALAAPMLSRDVFSYYAQGLLLADGVDPGTVGVSALPDWRSTGADPLWSARPSPYGPVALGVQAAIAEASADEPLIAVALFRVVSLISLLGLVIGLRRLVVHTGVNPGPVIWLVALNPLVLLQGVLAIHNDLWLVTCIVWAFVLALQRQALLGCIVAGLAGSIKPVALICLPFIALLLRPPRDGLAWRTAYAIVGVSVGAAVVAVTVILTGTGYSWLGATPPTDITWTWLAPVSSLAFALGWIAMLAGPATSRATMSAVQYAGLILALGLTVWLWLRSDRHRAVRNAGLALMSLVLLSPIVQPWYLLWGLPLVIAAGIGVRWTAALILGSVWLSLFSLFTSSATRTVYPSAGDDLLLPFLALALTAAVGAAVRITGRGVESLLDLPSLRAISVPHPDGAA